MSIEKMMAAHPDADAPTEAVALAVRHAMFCAAICTSCADADSAEDMDMRQCVRICLDCADICAATARVAIRRTGSNAAVTRAMLETCVAACDSAPRNASATTTNIAGCAPDVPRMRARLPRCDRILEMIAGREQGKA